MSRSEAFQRHLREMSSRLKFNAGRALEHYLLIAQNSASRANTTIYDGERVDGIESLVYSFAQGIEEVFRQAVFDTQADFDWLAANYGPMFDAGTRNAARGYTFQSAKNDDYSVTLGISPKNQDISDLVTLYEQAIVKKIIPAPNGFKLQFEDELYGVGKGVGLVFRSMVLEVER